MEVPIGVAAGSDPVRVVDIPERLVNKLDLLFVVDNSEEMSRLQQQLTQSFRLLYNQLAQNEIGLADLHVGVISTDLGVQDYAGQVDCSYSGDGGRLIQRSCVPSGERFLRQEHDPDGTLHANFQLGADPDAAIVEAFSCMANLGSDGCDYEQPLAAMEIALSRVHPESADFFRDDAVLGVVFLTNEDDCSVVDPTLFDPDNPDFNYASPDFRCFDHGVMCNGDDVRLVGRFDDCFPHPHSDYVADIEHPIRVLEAARPADRLVVAGVMGDASLVEVVQSLDGDPQLVPGCDDAVTGSAAYPAVRLQAFIDSFAGGVVMPLCGERARPLDPLLIPASRLRRALGTSCLYGAIGDSDDLAPGVQPACDVYRVTRGNPNVAADGVLHSVPACDDPVAPGSSSQLPCYVIAGSPACGGGAFDSNLALTIYGENGLPSGGGDRKIGLTSERVYADCVVETGE